jgi:hypothetical protein
MTGCNDNSCPTIGSNAVANPNRYNFSQSQQQKKKNRIRGLGAPIKCGIFLATEISFIEQLLLLQICIVLSSTKKNVKKEKEKNK